RGGACGKDGGANDRDRRRQLLHIAYCSPSTPARIVGPSSDQSSRANPTRRGAAAPCKCRTKTLRRIQRIPTFENRARKASSPPTRPGERAPRAASAALLHDDRPARHRVVVMERRHERARIHLED